MDAHRTLTGSCHTLLPSPPPHILALAAALDDVDAPFVPFESSCSLCWDGSDAERTLLAKLLPSRTSGLRPRYQAQKMRPMYEEQLAPRRTSF